MKDKEIISCIKEITDAEIRTHFKAEILIKWLLDILRYEILFSNNVSKKLRVKL